MVYYLSKLFSGAAVAKAAALSKLIVQSHICYMLIAYALVVKPTGKQAFLSSVKEATRCVCQHKGSRQMHFSLLCNFRESLWV